MLHTSPRVPGDGGSAGCGWVPPGSGSVTGMLPPGREPSGALHGPAPGAVLEAGGLCSLDGPDDAPLDWARNAGA